MIWRRGLQAWAKSPLDLRETCVRLTQKGRMCRVCSGSPGIETRRNPPLPHAYVALTSQGSQVQSLATPTIRKKGPDPAGRAPFFCPSPAHLLVAAARGPSSGPTAAGLEPTIRPKMVPRLQLALRPHLPAAATQGTPLEPARDRPASAIRPRLRHPKTTALRRR